MACRRTPSDLSRRPELVRRAGGSADHVDSGGHPLHEWAQVSPVVPDPVEQRRRVDRLLEAVGLAERQAGVAQQLDPRMVGGVAARRGLQLLTAYLEPALL